MPARGLFFVRVVGLSGVPTPEGLSTITPCFRRPQERPSGPRPHPTGHCAGTAGGEPSLLGHPSAGIFRSVVGLQSGDHVTADRVHRRSVGFLDRDDETWACFLVTFPSDEGRWKGYFSFRPRAGDAEALEVRTAEIFVEDSEGEIDRKARGLGRPLLNGLLSSALHTRDREVRDPPRLRSWFQEMLRSNARELAGEWEEDEASEEGRTLGELRSIYASYRLDQVSHLITLVRPEHFQDAVARILDGKSFDFGARDRLQFAMMVVEHLEALLPLPPFEVWAQDYLANEREYRLYTHALHREGRLP